MQVIFNGIVYEAKSPVAKVWYHGTTVDFHEFDRKYAQVENSNAQSGPGFYMTTDLDEAMMYAGTNGFIKEIKIVSRQFIKSSTAKPNISLARNAIRMIPADTVEDVLSNWGENPNKAKVELYNAMMDQENLGSQVQSIWYDCYHNREPQFCEVASRLMDGIVFPRQTTPVLVGYNPKNFKIVKTIKASEIKNGNS